MELPPADIPDRDDTLTVLFLCCHPALTPGSAVCLTLRAVGGLTTAQIASAFLVPEATMAQRISRAKQRIRASGVPFSLPSPEEQPAAVRTVLQVLYLMFNEGHTSSVGDQLHRADLSDEAIRIGRMAHVLMPEEPEVGGLLALMLLTDARRPARTDINGDPIPLAEQDRSRWDRSLIAEGVRLLDAAVVCGRVGPYQLQAAIAALHDRAETADQTDWSQIEALYGLLEQMTANPIVSLNRAVAVAMVHGPAAGLEIVDRLEPRIPELHRVDAVRAHLLELSGDTEAAIYRYRRAAGRTTNLPERRHLTMRAARLAARR
jgi:predicted RNA polymerase sigma factor